MPDTPPSNRDFGRYVAMSQVGMEMVAPIGIGLWVDYYFSVGPWGLIVGTVLGFVGGITHLVLLANQQNAADDRRPKGDPP